MSDLDFLVRFRSSGYADKMLDYLKNKLEASRVKNESEPSDSVNRARVLAYRQIMEDIFGEVR